MFISFEMIENSSLYGFLITWHVIPEYTRSSPQGVNNQAQELLNAYLFWYNMQIVDFDVATWNPMSSSGFPHCYLQEV